MGHLNGFFGRKLLPEDVEGEIFIYSPACPLCLFLLLILDLLKIKSHVWSILAFFGGGSKIQVTFPHVRVQITMIQTNEKH